VPASYVHKHHARPGTCGGRQAYFSNQRCVAAGDCDELEELWITVTNRTRDIQLREDGVTRTITTRVVQELETADGELVEISRNFFAVCQPTRDVYYSAKRSTYTRTAASSVTTGHGSPAGVARRRES